MLSCADAGIGLYAASRDLGEWHIPSPILLDSAEPAETRDWSINCIHRRFPVWSNGALTLATRGLPLMAGTLSPALFLNVATQCIAAHRESTGMRSIIQLIGGGPKLLWIFPPSACEEQSEWNRRACREPSLLSGEESRILQIPTFAQVRDQSQRPVLLR